MKEKIFKYLDRHGPMLLRGQALMNIKYDLKINHSDSASIYEEWRKNYIRIK